MAPKLRAYKTVLKRSSQGGSIAGDNRRQSVAGAEVRGLVLGVARSAG